MSQNAAEEARMALLDPTSWLFKKMYADEQFQQDLKIADIIELCEIRANLVLREKILEKMETERAERQEHDSRDKQLQQFAQQQNELENKMSASAKLGQSDLNDKIKQLEETRNNILRDMGPGISKYVEVLHDRHHAEMEMAATKLQSASLVNAQGASISASTREAIQQVMLAGPPAPLALIRQFKYNPSLRARFSVSPVHERHDFIKQMQHRLNLGKELEIINVLAQDGLVSSIETAISNLPKLARANKNALTVFEEMGHKIEKVNNELTDTAVLFCNAVVDKADEMRTLPHKLAEFFLTENRLSQARALLKPVPTLRR